MEYRKGILRQDADLLSKNPFEKLWKMKMTAIFPCVHFSKIKSGEILLREQNLDPDCDRTRKLLKNNYMFMHIRKREQKRDDQYRPIKGILNQISSRKGVNKLLICIPVTM